MATIRDASTVVAGIAIALAQAVILILQGRLSRDLREIRFRLTKLENRPTPPRGEPAPLPPEARAFGPLRPVRGPWGEGD